MQPTLFVLLLLFAVQATAQVTIGTFETRNHGVAGQLVALSDRVLEVRNFVFDGEAPAAFFWADTNAIPSAAGFKLLDAAPSSTCGEVKLPGADGSQTFTIEFPEGFSLSSIAGGSISVWCEQFSANFGEVIIPTTLEGVADAESGPSLACAPAVEAEPVSIGNLITRNHDVEGEVVFISESVLEIRNFRFDGSAPAAFFWADTRSNPSSAGFKLLDAAPTNKCGAEKLPGADGSQTFTIEFPEGTTVRDVLGGSISVWCEQFSANFGEIIIPSTLEGLASAADGPTLECSDAVAEEPPDFVSTPTGYNCEPLYEDLQVRWKVDGDNLDVELIGRIDESIYMSFGISGSDTKTDMLGADTIVCDFYQGIYRAIDFYMNSRAQCANGDGVCPDTVSDLNNDSTAVSGEQGAGLTIVRYTRPLTPTDLDGMVGGMTVDRSVSVEPGVATYIVWAVGPIDDDSGVPFFHNVAFPQEDVSLEFGRTIQDNCEPFVDGGDDSGVTTVTPFVRPILTETTEFTARIGPSAGPRGYVAITEQDAWGISWYINDILIPIIELRRGTTYTFRVNGGDDPEKGSEYHPLYLTSSLEGGYFQRSAEQREEETVYAGLDIEDRDNIEALAAGPLCLFKSTEDTKGAELASYAEYTETLDKSCLEDTTISNAAAILEFTPDEDTPDLLYYQCYTHRSLGWEIRVIDADAPSALQVDCTSTFRENTIDLADGLTLNAIINPNEMTLTAELILEGQAWLAMGFTQGATVMVGSEAVLGLPDDENGLTNPGKYDLNARDTSGVRLMGNPQQTLKNATIEQNSTHTVLTFTKLLVETDEHTISTESNTFLWAVGSGNGFGAHASRGGFTLTPNQCTVILDGEVQNPGAGQKGVSSSSDDNRDLWVAHGACAATAWAILVPLAIGSSIIRDLLESIGLPKGVWFQIHRGLNTIAAILTIVAFSIAVHLINQLPGAEHFTSITHHSLGLVIFILTLLQALGGIFRPHLPPKNIEKPEEVQDEEAEGDDKEAEGDDKDDQPQNEVAAEKSTVRTLWEYGHRIVGTAVLAMAWWQVQDGVGLFAQRFSDASDLTPVFWGVVGGICGVFFVLYVVQVLRKKKQI